MTLRKKFLGTATLILFAMTGCAAEDAETTEDDSIEADSEALGTLEYDIAQDSGTRGPHPSARIDRSWGYAFFEKYGDNVWVGDKASEGASVGVEWKTSYGRHGLCQNIAGDGSQRYCDKDFRETSTIWIRMGRCDAKWADCSKLASYRDWTRWEASTVGQ